MVKRIALGLSVALFTTLIAGGAMASLLGQTVTCSASAFVGAGCSSPTATVVDGGTPEFVIRGVGGLSDLFNIDISGEGVIISAPGGFSTTPGEQTVTLGDLFWSNDPTATITGITSFLVSGVEPNFGDGFLQSDITIAANAVTFDFGGTAWDQGGFVSFDLVTTHSALPEPATLALFGLGLAGLGFAARRKELGGDDVQEEDDDA